jgi:tetratricopeptide (TPR) repeat protein
VAYGSLLQHRRRALHGQILEAIERLYPDRLTEHIERLAHHAIRGENWEKAVTYLRQAAAKAAARSAHRDAVECLEQALIALTHLPESRETLEQAIDLRFELGSSLGPLAQFGRMSSYLRDAEQTAAALNDQHRLGWASTYLSYHLWQTAPPADACGFAERAQAIGEKLGDIPLTVNASICCGVTHLLSGQFRRAVEHLEKAVVLLDGELERQHCGTELFPSIVSRCWLVVVFAERGDFERGLAYGEEGVRLAESLDHPYSLGLASWALGYLYAAKGLYGDAIRMLEKSLALAHDWHLEILFPLVEALLGSAYAGSGRMSEGLSVLEQGLKAYGSGTAFFSLFTVHLGRVYVLVNRLDDALSSAERAIAVARERGELGHEAWALHLLGEIASHRDRPDVAAAEAHHHAAIGRGSELGMRPLVAHCHLGLGKLYRRTGKREQAQTHLTTATAMYREMDMTYWLERATTETNALG